MKINKYIRYETKYLQTGRKNDVKPYIIKVNNAIKGVIHDQKAEPIYSYKSLKNVLEYTNKYNIYSINCHLGQRKLALTEIEFYNKCVNLNNINNIIIYAGSASCEHLPVILHMFPKLKFLLIDPNYHSIDVDYKYVYQDINTISKSNHTTFKTQLKSKNKKRSRHLYNTTKELYNTKFIYDDTQTYNVIDIADLPHINKMKSFKKLFQNYQKNIFDIMVESTNRVFIIQDYMNIPLTLHLKQYIKKSKHVLKIYFMSDIRSVLIPKFGASDIDILHNSALQIIYLKELNPIYSMLKFRPPFFMQYVEITKLHNNNYEYMEHVKDVFDYVIKNYSINIVDNFLNKKFEYFKNDFIYVQPWAPPVSTESRLFVSQNNISKPFMNYDNIEWENKFYYFKFIRLFKYYPFFYEKLKKYPELHYDGCQDCSREIMILVDYIIQDQNKDKDYDFDKLLNKLDESNIHKLIYLYELMNTYTFFDLSKKNYKCSSTRKTPIGIRKIMHHTHTKHTKYINFYDKDLNYISIDDNNNMVKNY